MILYGTTYTWKFFFWLIFLPLIFVMVAFDVIVGVFRIVSLPAFDDMFEIMSQIEMLTHFTSYRGEENEGYMNTQYITYHLLGLLMIWGKSMI